MPQISKQEEAKVYRAIVTDKCACRYLIESDNPIPAPVHIPGQLSIGLYKNLPSSRTFQIYQCGDKGVELEIPKILYWNK